MLECGCGLDSREQPLTLETGNGRVPVELQHRSIVVKGWVRVINEEPKVEEEHLQLLYINAVKAEVTQALRLGPAGWSLDERSCGVGRHQSSCYQNPMLVRPEMSGKLARTTLLRDHGEWFVLELCEPLESLLDPSAEFYGYEGSRDTLTIITEGEKDPVVMDFKLLGDDPPLFDPVERQEVPDDIIVAPEDDVLGIEIGGASSVEGAQVPLEGRIVMSPSDMVLVNGAELNAEIALRPLRAALSFYGLSTSGSREKCFKRLLDTRNSWSFRWYMPLPSMHNRN